MNLPNKLTVLRVAMIPLCLLFILLGWYIPAAIVFALASATDYLDGYIARRDKLVTNFGKFADPVADKVLVLSVMVVLLAQGYYAWWGVVIVAVRELMVDGLRLVAVEQGIVIPAGKLGKVKTVAQMFSVMSALMFLPGWITLVLTILMSVLTAVSGWQYFNGGRALFKLN